MKVLLSTILEELPFELYLFITEPYMTKLVGPRFIYMAAIMAGLAIIAAKVIETVIIHLKEGKTEKNKFVIEVLCFCINTPMLFTAFKMAEHFSKVPGTTSILILLSIGFAIYHLVMSHISDCLVYNKRLFPRFLEEDDIDDDY